MSLLSCSHSNNLSSSNSDSYNEISSNEIISSQESSSNISSSSEISSSIHTHVPCEPVQENIIKATCINEGSYDEVIYCNECHDELSRISKTIDALGHDLIHHEGKTATCDEKGYLAYDTCSRCDYTTYQEIDAINHKYIFSSYSWDGYTKAYAHFICENDESHTLDKEMIIVKEVIDPVTCLEDGLNKYHASLFFENETYEDEQEETIPSLGHDYSIITTVKESNDYQDGLTKKECSRCHDIIEEIIPSTSPFTFLLNSDGESYTVTGYSPEGGYQGEDIVIPETFNSLPVNTIGMTGLFIIDVNPIVNILITKYVISNKSVVIKNLSCRYQTEETINRTYNSITAAFDTYPRTIEIYYKGTVEEWIDNSPFSRADVLPNRPGHKNYLYTYDYFASSYNKVEDLIIPDGVAQLPANCFSNISFKTVTCPSSLTSIGVSAINYSADLETVNLNEGLQSIRTNNFNGSQELLDVTIPSTFNKNTSLVFDSLYSVHVKRGATNYQSMFDACDHLIKIIDENDDTSYLNGKDLITKENEAESTIFDYMGYKTAKIVNKIYLIKYLGENINCIMSLPQRIVYEGSEYTDIYLKNSFLYMASATAGLQGMTVEDILAAYNNDFNEIKHWSPDFLAFDFYRSINIPKNIKMEKRALSNVPYLADIFYDGSYEEWQTIVSQTSNFANANTEIVHILEEGGQYVDYPLKPIS